MPRLSMSGLSEGFHSLLTFLSCCSVLVGALFKLIIHNSETVTKLAVTSTVQSCTVAFRYGKKLCTDSSTAPMMATINHALSALPDGRPSEPVNKRKVIIE